VSSTALTVLAIAALVSLGLWLSMIAARFTEMELLPAHSRRRVQWWQANAGHVQIGCALLAVAAACIQLGSTF
jgi:hypothetical protein